ncbi:hypothetical protein L249_3689 [Ophiocordyceps polyrhachis-furcata BCC 54312]|uniref:DUF202 domain-containing protein n=1 Tax=Ophiocordyceps polyrhachis-furcata BCC 54312 TaxID=1330021 RepID=A0A367L4P7_9HYPO|nr:hypothetical protein L249_3689 [Ophiocordyceps polyrhachis-furcata BCC 54312]
MSKNLNLNLNANANANANANDAPPKHSKQRRNRPLLFENESSDARDHCANERTFLSYLRLATYMTVVAVAMTVSFQLNQKPSQLERRIARPLGIAFWLLSLVTLFMGLGNYIKTVNKYGQKAAIILALLAFSIISTCVILLITERLHR